MKRDVLEQQRKYEPENGQSDNKQLLVCDACDGEGYIPEQECCGNGYGNECCGCPDIVWERCAKCEGIGKEIK